MDILTRMRNTTAADLANVRADFDDAPVPVYVSRKPKEMVRIVAGADDLRHPNAGSSNGGGGLSITQDWSDVRDSVTGDDGSWEDQPGGLHDADHPCNNPRCCPTGTPGDTPIVRTSGITDRQRDTIGGLLGQLMELDIDTFNTATEYTRKMNEHNAWTPGRTGNASRWIGNLIAKVRELKAAAPKVVATGDDAKFQGIPNGYYAINDSGAPDDIHFFRVSRFRDGGIKVQEQASDELHPVRRGGRRTAILTTIQHVGPANAAALYGRTIGRCGRCNRTLTDSLSRSRGIGPDCWGKM